MKEDIHPFAINILKLRRYNFDFFTTEEVVFFEYIVVKQLAFKTKGAFFHSSETIRRETGIKKYALNTIIKRFVNLGILKVTVKGMPQVKYFTLCHEGILALLPKIYLLQSPKAQQIDLEQLLRNYLHRMAEP